MNGNTKIKVAAKKVNKLLNILGFVESQMELLIEKFDEIDMHSEAEEIISMINTYSNFNERVSKELKGAIND
jgi:hypothetical protein